MDQVSDLDRMFFFEHARKSCEIAYTKNPLDTENLTRWAGVLIELSQFQSPEDSKALILDAVTKLEEAIAIEPKNSHALWCLGNAHQTLGFITPAIEEAKIYFGKAAVSFQQAADEDPSNELFRKSMEVSAQSTQLHADIHSRQPGLGQQSFMDGPSSSNSNASKTKTRSGLSDFTYDVLGWACLAVGVVVWLGFVKNNVPPPPPAR